MKSALALVVALIIFSGLPTHAQTVATGMAPDFTLTDVNGKIVSLSKNYGQGPIYVTFWATWCKPCIEELKIIEKIYEKYQDKGFRVFAINTEGPRAIAKIKSFVSTYGMTFDILLDNDGEVFRRKYKGAALPLSTLTDSKGKVLFSSLGFRPGDEVKVEKLIVDNLIIPKDTTSTATPEN